MKIRIIDMINSSANTKNTSPDTPVFKR